MISLPFKLCLNHSSNITFVVIHYILNLIIIKTMRRSVLRVRAVVHDAVMEAAAREDLSAGEFIERILERALAERQIFINGNGITQLEKNKVLANGG